MCFSCSVTKTGETCCHHCYHVECYTCALSSRERVYHSIFFFGWPDVYHRESTSRGHLLSSELRMAARATISNNRIFEIFSMLIGHFLLTLLKIRQSLFPLKRSIGHRSIPARRNVNEIDERSHLHFPSFLYFASFRMPPALLHRKGPSSSRDSQRIPSENVWKREWSPRKCFFRHPPVSDPFRSTKWKQILRIHSSGLQKQRGKGLK